jgi:hypothetical protein
MNIKLIASGSFDVGVVNEFGGHFMHLDLESRCQTLKEYSLVWILAYGLHVYLVYIKGHKRTITSVLLQGVTKLK